jgi:hypothetical protein
VRDCQPAGREAGVTVAVGVGSVGVGVGETH